MSARVQLSIGRNRPEPSSSSATPFSAAHRMAAVYQLFSPASVKTGAFLNVAVTVTLEAGILKV